MTKFNAVVTSVRVGGARLQAEADIEIANAEAEAKAREEATVEGIKDLVPRLDAIVLIVSQLQQVIDELSAPLKMATLLSATDADVTFENIEDFHEKLNDIFDRHEELFDFFEFADEPDFDTAPETEGNGATAVGYIPPSAQETALDECLCPGCSPHLYEANDAPERPQMPTIPREVAQTLGMIAVLKALQSADGPVEMANIISNVQAGAYPK